MDIAFSKKENIKDNILVLLVPLIIFLMSVTRNGNLNLLYFSAPFVFLLSVREKSFSIKKLVIFYIPFLIIFLVTLTFSKYYNNLGKSLIYLLKLFLCLILFVSASSSYIRKDLFEKCVNNLIYIIFFFTLFAIVTQSDFLWRFNDTINAYSSTRLQLFFMEPSELSEVCGVILIYKCVNLREKNINSLDFFHIIAILIPLFLSAGLSGIVYSFLAIIFFFFISESSFFKKGKISKTMIVLFLALSIFLISFFLFQNNKIFARIIAVLEGKDGSFNYRYVRAVDALGFIFRDTNGIGVGLGNLRTERTAAILSDFGLLSFSNSYLFFIAEGGILALLYLMFLISYCFTSIYKQKNYYFRKCNKYALLFFLIIIQITGGYFTDPFLWMMTGLVISKNGVM